MIIVYILKLWQWIIYRSSCVNGTNVDGHGLSNSSLVMSLNNKEDDSDDVVPVEVVMEVAGEVGDARGGMDV